MLVDGDGSLMRKMLEHIKPEIMETYDFAEMPAIIFKIYTGEIQALITDWGKRGFAEDEIETVYRNLIFLTKNCT